MRKSKAGTKRYAGVPVPDPEDVGVDVSEIRTVCLCVQSRTHRIQ
jgi:hypothetical protein